MSVREWCANPREGHAFVPSGAVPSPSAPLLLVTLIDSRVAMINKIAAAIGNGETAGMGAAEWQQQWAGRTGDKLAAAAAQ